MTKALAARLRAHHARTEMMTTEELYNAIPAIITALEGVEEMREALASAKRFLEMAAKYDPDDGETLTRLAACETLAVVRAALKEKP